MKASKIAKQLRVGVNSDIWFDANQHGDEGAMKQIEATQEAMEDAARLLESMDTAGKFTVIGRLHETDDVEIFHANAKTIKEAESAFVKELASTYDCTVKNIKNRCYDVYAIFPGHIKEIPGGKLI